VKVVGSGAGPGSGIDSLLRTTGKEQTTFLAELTRSVPKSPQTPASLQCTTGKDSSPPKEAACTPWVECLRCCIAPQPNNSSGQPNSMSEGNEALKPSKETIETEPSSFRIKNSTKLPQMPSICFTQEKLQASTARHLETAAESVGKKRKRPPIFPALQLLTSQKEFRSPTTRASAPSSPVPPNEACGSSASTPTSDILCSSSPSSPEDYTRIGEETNEVPWPNAGPRFCQLWY